MFKLTTTDASADELHGMRAYRSFDSSSSMHTEVVFPEVARGAMAVSYMGLAGTYEHNRQHFKDFLTNLSLPARSVTDSAGARSTPDAPHVDPALIGPD